RALFAGVPLFVSGGLTPDNVAQAIAQARPSGVDVASGIENGSGYKDPARVRAFVRAARGTDFKWKKWCRSLQRKRPRLPTRAAASANTAGDSSGQRSFARSTRCPKPGLRGAAIQPI